MDPHALAVMIALFAINITGPGPNTFLVLQSRLVGGPREADAVIAGACVGGMLWALASLLGVALVLGRVPVLATGLQLAGGTWLFVAGYRASTAVSAPAGIRRRVRSTGGFAGGFASSALNPNNAVFFVAVVPPLLSGTSPTVLQIGSVALVYGGLEALWFSALAFAVARGRGSVSSPRLAAGLARLPGVALMGFGFLFVAAA